MGFIHGENLEYFYRDGDNKRYILRDLSCEFEKGVFYSILGKSGSGKTTLLSLLSALDESTKGTIYFDGKDIKEIGYDKYRRNNISIIFQSYNLIPYMTALQNVLLAMSLTDNELPKNKEQVAYNLLDYIGITKAKADRLVTKLSGGEQQRVAIARSLSTNVDFIIADEPTGNLDEAMEKEIIEIFQKLAHDHNKCVVVVTHSKEIAKKSDTTCYLRDGKLTVHV